MSALADVARYDGLCPLCCRAIRAGKSRILPLEVGLVPNPQWAIYDPFDGGSWHFAGYRGTLRRHRYAHAACWNRLKKRYPTTAERIALADEWTAELRERQAKRDAEMAECERRWHGRSQSPRRSTRA